MRASPLGRWGLGLFAVAVLGLSLSGCSSSDYGNSSFGSANVEIAELKADAALTANSALVHARGHFRNNDFGHAAAYYKKAAELAPNSAEAYIGLGASYDRLGRFDLSDRVYTALLKLSGPTLQYYNNFGYSMLLRGNLRDALTNFRKAEKLDPGNIVVANNLQLLADAAAGAKA